MYFMLLPLVRRDLDSHTCAGVRGRAAPAGRRVRDFTVKPGSAFRFHRVCEVHSETEMCEMPDVTSSSKLPGDLWWTSQPPQFQC